MEYPVKTDGIFVSKVVFEENSEQTVDADYALPDYCPDIRKILKCQIEPHIESKNIIGDRVEIEGTGVVRIIYIDAIKDSVRCTEQSYPFSISSNLKDIPRNAVIQTDMKVNYLNCRALSPRRLNIHGAFNVCVKVIDKSEVRTCTHIQGEDIQQKKQNIDYSYLEGLSQQQFSVTETLETGQNRPAIQAIIRSDIRALCTECKPIANKIMYKGDLLVKIMYLSDLDIGKVETMEYNIPFSQVIDLNGVSEESQVSVRTELMTYSVALRSEIGFDDPLPVLSAKICVTAFSYEKRDTIVINDCYSTKYYVDSSYSAYTLPLLADNFKETIIEKSNIDFSEASISKVVDAWVEKGNVVCTQDSQLSLNGKYNVCILAVDTDNSFVYTERTMEYTHPLQISSTFAKLNYYAAAECISVGFRFCSEKRIEVRTELLVTGEIYDVCSVNAVSGIKADENKPRVNDDSASLILYFASKGEDVWGIARDYCTDVSRVREENDLTDDVLTSDRMLMIPV